MSMWEQLGLAAFLQKHWADNQVSCTVTFDPATEGPQVAKALEMYQFQLKGVSLLPRAPTEAYPQLPYEAISEAEYKAAVERLKPLDATQLQGGGAGSATPGAEKAPPDAFCDAPGCSV